MHADASQNKSEFWPKDRRRMAQSTSGLHAPIAKSVRSMCKLLQYASFSYCACCIFLCLREATRGVNGPLLEALCKWSKYHDAECINMFRDGADLVGYLKASGNGVAIENEGFIDIGRLTSDAPAMNRQVSFIHMRLCRLRCLSLAPWCVVRLLLSGI